MHNLEIDLVVSLLNPPKVVGLTNTGVEVNCYKKKLPFPIINAETHLDKGKKLK